MMVGREEGVALPRLSACGESCSALRPPCHNHSFCACVGCRCIESCGRLRSKLAGATTGQKLSHRQG